jgi:hypothetical protein
LKDRLKETGCALSLRFLENLDQNQKPRAPAATRAIEGCPYRKSNPYVLMVQSTKDTPHLDSPSVLNDPSNGRIFA